MQENKTIRRSYDSVRRQQQARETRLRIAESARRLFLTKGYERTTISAIATAAGVAPPTVYAVFGGKRSILSFLLEISIGGDDRPIPLLERPGPQAVLHEPDPRRQVGMFAHDITFILERTAPIFELLRGVSRSDAELAALVSKLLQERLENVATFIRHVANNGGLRAGVDIPSAAELAAAITSPEVFLLMTRDYGYSMEKYVAWLDTALARLLLA